MYAAVVAYPCSFVAYIIKLTRIRDQKIRQCIYVCLTDMKHLLCILLGCCLALPVFSQDTVIQIKQTALANDVFIHLDNAPWRFKSSAGSQWQMLPGTDFGSTNPPPGWSGTGWFSLEIQADAALIGKKLAIQLNHDGASEIFIDGRPVGGYGILGTNAASTEVMRAPRSLIPFWLQDTLPHLVTLHYANFQPAYPDFWGFQLAIGDYKAAFHKMAVSTNRLNFLLTTVAAHCILGFLSLFLYLFYPAQKLNLYYAIFVFLLGITMFSIYLFYQTLVPSVQFYAEIGIYFCKVLMMWAGSIMLYAVGYPTIPRLRVVAVSLISFIYIALNLALVFFSSAYEWNDYFSWVFLLFTIDGFISVYYAVKRKLPGVWLVAAGMAAISVVYFFAWGDVFGLWPSQLNSLRLLVIAIGNLIFPACFSLYLALDYARTNQHLVQKLGDVEVLYKRNLAQEAEKLELVLNQAATLEATVRERTAEIQQQADKLKEMDTIKSRFFTNLTHEFKTPLTLILSPAQELVNSPASDSMVQHHARLIQSNAARLLQLINQLLDLTRLESGLQEVNTGPVELVSEIKSQLQLYSPLALQKEIQVFFHSNYTALQALIDKDKFNKILHNLLSNAFKFTQKGNIQVTLNICNNETMKIRVKDSGSGIPRDKLPYIFERFYQADADDTRNHEGTGIGLALARELAVLMGGTISAESVEHVYTTFILTLPCHIIETTAGNPLYNLFEIIAKPQEALPEVSVNEESGLQLVLVIEDNDGLREFLCHILGSNYKVITAPDGASGLLLAQEQIPDVVITDIMMPGADGYAVSKALKTDVRTSHIPVIILTAKSGTENRVLGLETGADAYLEKPFNQQELLTIIENVINLRSLLQQKYSNSQLPFTIDRALPSIEQDFISRVQSFIKENLHDPQFGTDQLALLMTLSRSQLHRKLKGLLDRSPGELIRHARMEHAHYLLKTKAATPAEVAYKIGFTTPSSFTHAFSRHFGFAPGDVNQDVTFP